MSERLSRPRWAHALALGIPAGVGSLMAPDVHADLIQSLPSITLRVDTGASGITVSNFASVVSVSGAESTRSSLRRIGSLKEFCSTWVVEERLPSCRVLGIFGIFGMIGNPAVLARHDRFES